MNARLASLSLGLVIGLSTFVACGGAIEPTSDTFGSSSGSTSSSGSSGIFTGSSGSSGTGSSSGSSGIGSCISGAETADRVCVPPTAISNQPITVDVDTLSCLTCGQTLDTCRVDVTGTTITLTMAIIVCSDSQGECSSAGCAPKTTCTIPPLAAGTYSVTVSSPDEFFAPRDLVVADDGIAASCTLPASGGAIPPLDASQYDSSCTSDSDCVAVLAGQQCGSCGCNNAVINTSDKARFDADQRALSSECEPSGPVPCPECPAFQAYCNLSPDALTGTCASRSLAP